MQRERSGQIEKPRRNLMRSKHTFFLLAALTLVLAFAFQGSRGIWEPDEGFYIGAARTMVESGDWTIPQMNLRPFLEKPPIVYWGSAVGMSVFGFNEWGARLGHAVWFVLSVWVVGGLAASIWDRKTGYLSALIYATSAVPLVAANIVTPDTPLAFWATAAMACFWMSLESEGWTLTFLWRTALALSASLGILSKGPALLVFLAPMALYLLLSRQVKRFVLRWDTPFLLVLFVALSASWYVAIFQMVPGAIAYAWDNQVMGRLFTKKFNRNPQFYKPLVVYFPIAFLGTLPWSIAWYPQFFRIRTAFRGWVKAPRLAGRRPGLLLGLWVTVPFVVFCFASSRLPLYILPLFAPMCIISARCWLGWKPSWFEGKAPRGALAALVVWCVLLLVSKVVLANWPTYRDTRAYWEGIRRLLPSGRTELVVVDGRRHGLSFYSCGNVEWVTLHPDPYPFFIKPEPFEVEVHELRSSAEHHVFIVRNREHEVISNAIRKLGIPFEEKAGPFETHLLICPPAPPNNRYVRLAAMGDTRSGDSLQIQLGAALYHIDEEKPLNGVVLLGDNISYDGNPGLFPEHIEKPYEPLISNGIPFYAVLGNHDVSGGFASFQMNHPLFNMNGHRYYTRVFGDGLVQCFFLDSTTFPNDKIQIDWLRRELQKSGAAWKVAAMHYPLYGRTERRHEINFDLRKDIEPLLVEGGVDIVLAGHNHVYQRLRPKLGIQHFTAGSGGELDRGAMIWDDPDLLAGQDQTTVALVLEFSSHECHFEAVNGLEQVLDRGVIPLDPEERMRLDSGGSAAK